MGRIKKKTKVETRMAQPKVKTIKKAKSSTLSQAKMRKTVKDINKQQIQVEEEDEWNKIDVEEDMDEQCNNINTATSDDDDNKFESDEIQKFGDDDSDVDEGENGFDVDNESDDEGNDSEFDNKNKSDEDDEGMGDEVHDHKSALARLKDTDPEFYKFLQDNDKKLLNFNVSDSEGDSEDDEEDEEIHKPGELEVASDESDYEDEKDEAASGKHVTLKMLKAWQQELQLPQKSNKTIILVLKAFNSALCSVSPDTTKVGSFVTKGGAIFNGVVQLCVLYLGPAVRSFLQLKKGQPPHKSKRFTKIKTAMKQYFSDLHDLICNVTSGNILNVLLKHLHYMSSILVSFQTCGKAMVKNLIKIWGSSTDESVRVVAFLCILRLVNLQRDTLLDHVLKTMYIVYVKNSKFVSVNTLPSINFMRRSLVEIYALDTGVAYHHVFLYIRQLAINLRNATVDNKKENVHTVYNWQFINSCKLWGNFLAQTSAKPQVQSLIYPFVQVCLGTLKLVPTAAYFPLRFQLVQILIDLSRDSGVFICVLPFLTEVLTSFDFNKKHAKVSMKPLTFTTVLRMGKAQMTENGFKDTIIDTLYGSLLDYLAAHSHSIAFPDLALFARRQIKIFLGKCSVAKYQRKMQQLLEKIEANVAFIEAERLKISCDLCEQKKIEGFEMQLKNRGTPLSIFFESFNKVRNIKRSKQATNNEEMGDYNLPTLNKYKVKNTVEPRKHVDSDGKVVLFPSDDESEEEETPDNRTKRGKRAGKTARKERNVFVKGLPDVGEDNGDVVQDIVDW